MTTQSLDFSHADHTIILSDIHLSEAEPPHPNNPLWKRYKRARYFVDRSLRRLIEHMQSKISGTSELVLNGDIFDFDSVMAIPEGKRTFPVNTLEKRRGLNSEEPKSRFKIKTILEDHPVFVQTLREWVLSGNRIVFVIGNHDIELHWPSVQGDIVDSLNLAVDQRERVRFCEWFYISNGDTLIEHGNQYDAYCLCQNPIHPLIRVGFRPHVRLPFGNLAGKYMVNGMGLINPHAESSFIMSLSEWLRFFYKYVIRVQPLLIFAWLWGAIFTLIYSVSEGLLPAIKDPLTIESRVEHIAQKANATPYMVRSLRELHVHPAIFNPFKILRELWLDRALLLVVIFVASFQIFSLLNLFTRVSIWVFFGSFAALLPVLFYYGRSVKSEVYELQQAAVMNVGLATQITRVNRAVHGHTHREMHMVMGDVELINTGTWSPAFTDPECMHLIGQKCFAWIKPREGGTTRVAELYVWNENEIALIPEKRESHPLSVFQ